MLGNCMNKSIQETYLKLHNSVKAGMYYIQQLIIIYNYCYITYYIQQTTTFYLIFSSHLGSSFKSRCISFIKDITQDISNIL